MRLIRRRQPKKVISSSSSSTISRVPHDVVTEILGRVASSSLTDLFHAKQTCRLFNEVGQDNLVLKRISMDTMPVVQWHPSPGISSFLKRCEKAQNPEVLYRLGMVEFFGRKRFETGRKLLERAADLGHKVATYVIGIILLDRSSDDQSRRQGIELLDKITTKNCNRSRNEEVQECRKKSKIIFRQLWIDRNVLRPQERVWNNPMCDVNGQVRPDHRRRDGWLPNKGEDEDVFDCETCKWDHEFTVFRNML